VTAVTGTLDGSVELLDRSLSYTRFQLAGVREDQLGRPTPCAAWTLDRLLAHMEDSLDAFTEAAGGTVEVYAASGAAGHVSTLQDKACTLLGAWSEPLDPGPVLVGGRELASRVLVATAALEITGHGWDVGQSTGAGDRIPLELAAALLEVAEAVVVPEDRGVRFARARLVAADAPADVRLLAFLGRS
jgi:uncharacterized protein (TIGR03086 family)